MTSAQFVGGADDRVSDQMRQMAGDRQNEIVMLGRHCFDIGAERAPECGEPLDRGGVGAFGRGENAPAADEQVRQNRRPGPNARCPRPDAPGRNAHWRVDAGPMSRTIAPLTEPTSDTIALRLSGAARSRLAISPQAPTGAQTMTRSAPATAAAAVSTTWSANAEFGDASPRRRGPGTSRRFRARRPVRAPPARSTSRSGRRRSAPGG